jgi:hypothetical protein
MSSLSLAKVNRITGTALAAGASRKDLFEKHVATR